MTIKDFIQTIKIVVLAGVLAVGVSYVSAIYVGPSGAPGNNNAAAPIHIGLGTQTKSGSLGISGGLRVQGPIIFDSGAGAGKVLTSDRSGNALWKDPQVGESKVGAINNNHFCIGRAGTGKVECDLSPDNAHVAKATTADNGINEIVTWDNPTSSAGENKSIQRVQISDKNFKMCFVTYHKADNSSNSTCGAIKDGSLWYLEHGNVSAKMCVVACII